VIALIIVAVLLWIAVRYLIHPQGAGYPGSMLIVGLSSGFR
jgi:hypothetical protein